MRYQKILSQIWFDEKFSLLTPSQKLLFLYILTCPHGNLIGCFVLREGYVCSDLNYSAKDFRKDFEKLLEKDLIKACRSQDLVLIPNFLKYNPLTNPNQKKAAAKIIQQLPKSKLLQHFKGLIEGLPEGLWEGLLKPEDRRQKTEDRILAQTSPPSAPNLRENASPFFSCKHFEVSQEHHTELLKDHPALSPDRLLLEIKKMKDWLDDNPHRHKRNTKGHLKNPKMFIRNWLQRVVVKLEPAAPKEPDPQCPICRGRGREFYEENGEKLSRDCQCLRRQDG